MPPPDGAHAGEDAHAGDETGSGGDAAGQEQSDDVAYDGEGDVGDDDAVILAFST